MKKINISVKQLLREDEDLKAAVPQAPKKKTGQKTDQKTGSETDPETDPKTDPDETLRQETVIEMCVQSSRLANQGRQNIVNCISAIDQFAKSGGKVTDQMTDFVSGINGSEAERLSAPAQTVKKSKTQAFDGEGAQDSCMEMIGGSPLASVSAVLLGGVVVPSLWNNYFSPTAASRISGIANIGKYLLQNLGNTVKGLGWEKSKNYKDIFNSVWKGHKTTLAMSPQARLKAIQSAGAVTVIGGTAAAVFLYADRESGDVDPALRGQARENARGISEWMIMTEYVQKVKKAFKWVPVLDESKSYFWQDPCWGTVFVASIVTSKVSRRLIGGKTAYASMRESVKVMGRGAAAEARTIIGSLDNFVDAFFKKENLEQIMKNLPDSSWKGSRSGTPAVALKSSGFLEELNEAMRKVFTARGNEQAIEAAKQELSLALKKIKDTDAVAYGHAITYMDEVRIAFELGERATMNAALRGGPAGDIMRRVSSFVGEKAGAMARAPALYFAGRSSPKRAGPVVDDITDEITSARPSLEAPAIVDNAVDSSFLNKKLKDVEDIAKRQDDQTLKTLFHGIPFTSRFGKGTPFNEIIAASKAAMEVLNKELVDEITRIVVKKQRSDLIRSFLTLELGSPAGVALDLARKLKEGAPIPIAKLTTEEIQVLTESVIKSLETIARSNKYRSMMKGAIEDFASKVKKGTTKREDTLNKLEKAYDEDVGRLTQLESELAGPQTLSQAVPEAIKDITEEVFDSFGLLRETSGGFLQVERLADDLLGELGDNTKLAALSPKNRSRLKNLVVTGGLVYIIYKSVELFNLQVEDIHSPMSEEGDSITTVLNKIPEGEGTFVSRAFISSIRYTFYGKSAEASFVKAHLAEGEELNPVAQKQLVQDNLEGLYYRNLNIARKVFRAKGVEKVTDPNLNQKSLFGLVKDIREDNLGDGSVEDKTKIVLDRFCKIRSEQLTQVSMAMDDQASGPQDADSQKQNQKDIKFLSQIVASAYILENEQFVKRISALLQLGDPEDDQILQLFVFDQGDVGPVQQYLFKRAKDNPLVLKIGDKKVKLSRKEQEKTDMNNELEKLQRARALILRSGTEVTMDDKIKVNNLSKQIEDLEAEIEKTKQTRESTHYDKNKISNLVMETLRELTYGQGYTPYPYHSDIGRDEEPVEDYIQDWKDFELSLVRDQTRSTAIDLAKILVKDLELFGDVVDLIGKNQSIGTEILKKFKKEEKIVKKT